MQVVVVVDQRHDDVLRPLELEPRAHEDLHGARLDEPVHEDRALRGGLDGVDTARRLRREWPVPILFISAYADPATRERALAAAPGAMLLGKPVSATALEKAVVTLTARG